MNSRFCGFRFIVADGAAKEIWSLIAQDVAQTKQGQNPFEQCVKSKYIVPQRNEVTESNRLWGKKKPVFMYRRAICS